MNFVPTGRRALAVPALAMASVLALCACGKSSEPAQPTAAPVVATTVPAPVTPTSMQPATPGSAVAPASTPAPVAGDSSAPTTPAQPLEFAALNLGTQVGKDFKVTHAGKRFNANDHTLYAAVNTTGQATGANLSAVWTYEDGQKVNEITQSISADGPATTTFKVHNRNDWPVGKYKVAITLDGKAVSTQDFEIVKR